MTRIAFIALSLALLGTGIALGQAEAPIAPSIAPPIITTAPASGPSGIPGATLPSAQSILQDLLHEQGAPGSIESASATTGPALGADGLLREGQQIQLRSGHLKKDEAGGTVFIFDDRDTPKYPPMGVIPSRRLERMEDVAFADGRTGADTTFKIDAEVTQFRGKNYLYIKPNGIALPATHPASGPASTAAAKVPVKFVDVVAPNTPVTVIIPETSIITSRTVSFVRDVKTGLELVSFYADGKQMYDPPMGLIPCKSLAVLEDLSSMGDKPIKFTVSGEVTQYRGKNFLYVKTVWEVADRNQGIGHFNPTPLEPVTSIPTRMGK